MTISPEFAFGVVLAAVALGIAVYTMLRRPTQQLNREEALAREVHKLNATVDSLLTRTTTDQGRITALERELAEARLRITELERELAFHRKHSNGGSSKARPALLKKLLIVGGPDDNVLQLDEDKLTASGILYTRLRQATVDDIQAEFARMAQDRRAYPWVLISGHANSLGTLQVGGLMSTDQWMGCVQGAEVVMLAACQTTSLADHLGGRIPFVAYFREDVPSGAASRFANVFFQRLNAGELPEEAFRFGLAAVPEVSPYVDYRKRGTP